MCLNKGDNVAHYDGDTKELKHGIVYAKNAEGTDFLIMERGSYELKFIKKEHITRKPHEA